MRNIHPFRQNSSLKPLLFCRGRDSRRASRESLRIKYKKWRGVFGNFRKTPITLFKRNAALCRLRFTEVANQRAVFGSLRIEYWKVSKDVFGNFRKRIKRLLAPAQRRRPDAICFCFAGRLSPQAKDLCGKLSTNDNITLSPAYGGRKKRNGKSGQLQRVNPQKQIGRTSTGKTACFCLCRRLKATIY